MRKCICYAVVAVLFMVCSTGSSAQDVLGKLKQKIKSKTEQRLEEKIDRKVDKTLDEAENSTKRNEQIETAPAKQTPSLTPQKDTSQQPLSLKIYQNYDFVPGDKILFEDSFADDQNGEFATHWELLNGQAVLNKLNGDLALYLLDGNYARVRPRIKNEKYLTDPFTIEFDYYYVPGAYGLITMLQAYDKEAGADKESALQVNGNEVTFTGGNNGVYLSKSYTAEGAESFENKWHHIAIAVKNNQLKVYVDQNRMLVVPDTKERFEKVEFACIGSEQTPVVFKNLRIASGGGINLIGKKFTDAKIVTHGINFDIDKATIKPESMGTLNMIVNIMKENPQLKFSIEGHTDNTGSAVHNLALSQQRAEEVKKQLVILGIDGSRLTVKGLGDTKPISDNTTIEGKANNRRVEFVKF